MKLAILDRDGVINQDSDQFIKSVDEWQPIEGSLNAIARLNHAGWRVVVASNQSALARGLLTLDTLNAIHEKMHRLLAPLGGHIDAVYFCPHGPGDECRCRKPRPGLLQQIAASYPINLRQVPFIGDSLRDIKAAMACGAKPVLVRTGKGKKTEKKLPELHQPVAVYESLADWVNEELA
ncbi:MAG: D-glycero-beta-D-manno-heptose 1,7-bisphosphate 7-phosphatase [gamma proteobacterium symbiont of Bathyaustriella thionipta]|nr:D-glycero-beta-D-manno-heptose 1,7-bisphosphate 7-phosphatase [gamma proteobacterium symbiont of Bathyaustriella thionipta]